jgi:ribonuclease-3
MGLKIRKLVQKSRENVSVSDDPESFSLSITELETSLGYTFKRKELLLQALTHSSAVGEGLHYERLEFLGDAVLDLAIAYELLALKPQASEGELSKVRATLVRAKTLAEVARGLSVGTVIRFSRGEEGTGGQDKESILADVIEAILGGIFLDSENNFEAVLLTVRRIYGERINFAQPEDPKTELQELAHILGKGVPKYHLESQSGPAHQPIFVSRVIIDGVDFGAGSGPSKKASEAEAAAFAITKFKNP